jgi:hypothetical protein
MLIPAQPGWRVVIADVPIGEDGNAWSSLEDCLKHIGDGLLEAHTEWLAELAERAA